jgi:hypothetical protein
LNSRLAGLHNKFEASLDYIVRPCLKGRKEGRREGGKESKKKESHGDEQKVSPQNPIVFSYSFPTRQNEQDFFKAYFCRAQSSVLLLQEREAEYEYSLENKTG